MSEEQHERPSKNNWTKLWLSLIIHNSTGQKGGIKQTNRQPIQSLNGFVAEKKGPEIRKNEKTFATSSIHQLREQALACCYM